MELRARVGLGDSVGPDEYDFASTAMHELLHSFGFLSYIDARGKNTGRSWTSMDRFIVTSTGAKPIGSGYRWNTAYDGNLTGAKGGLFFGAPMPSPPMAGWCRCSLRIRGRAAVRFRTWTTPRSPMRIR